MIPHFGDQKFFAREIRRLGVGISLRLSRWPEELPRAVRIVERSKKRLKKARRIAGTLETENGSQEAVKVLEQLVLETKEI